MTLVLIGPPMAPPVELHRWLMQRHGVAHRFEPRAAALHGFQQRRLGLAFELPLLLTPEGPVGGLRPSLADLEARLARRGAALFPAPGDRDWAEGIMGPLFPAGVKSFYWHMLKAPRVLAPAASAGVPWFDAVAVRLGYPIWRRVMEGGLELDAFDPAAAEATISALFDRVAGEVRGAFLDGAKPGVRDIVFAVMASPVILPAAHPATLPPVADLPPAFRALVNRCRAHPAGVLATRVYASTRYHNAGGDCADVETG
jgi:hypothetical protein